MKPLAAPLLALALLSCRQEPAGEAPSDAPGEANTAATGPNADINASLETVAEAPSHGLQTPSFIGRWAPTADLCANSAWRFTENALQTPSANCQFSNVREVPDGFDIAARCTIEGAATRDDVLRLRFSQINGGLMVESDALPDMGMYRCPD
jgi:hypothetical protein